VIQSHSLSAHLYADDTQVYGSCRPADVVSFSSGLSRCVDETSGWMKFNRLQSNPDKAEVLWCTTSRRHQLPTTPFQSMELTSTQRSQSATWVSILMPTWSCGHTSNVRYRDVSLHSVNCARSAVQCHQTHSSH